MYHEPYVRVMPRDPGHMFAFWEQGPEIAEKTPPTALAAAQPLHPVLRVYEIVHSRKGEQAARFVGDIPLEKNVRSQYIRVPQSGATYRVELGECDESGRYSALVASNDVAMPDTRVHDSAPNPGFKADTAKLIELSARSATVSPVPPEAATGSDILSVEPETTAPVGLQALGSHFMPHPGSADNPLSNNSGQLQ